MDAKIVWDKKMAFHASSDSGFRLNLDTVLEQGGDESGFRPLELLLIGLAGCTAMDVISILLKKRQDVTGFEVHAHADRAQEHPKVFTTVTIEYILTGHNIDPAAVDRAVELSEKKYCPAQAMLEKAVRIEHIITIR